MVSSSHNDEHPDAEEDILRLAEERLTVTREEVLDGHVTVKRRTLTHDEPVSLMLRRNSVDVTHVPKNERIAAMPEVREEGGVLIVPVVEEEIEIVRRLVLKEELHIRRTEEQFLWEETVPLRKQHVEIERKKDDT
ncbi:YsnF/AvaK domain-containing protein [Pantoea sp. KPR_PJ]|uniref:YsnF/AvaK domain-containing protein n=1 Tax=Pantoea sp. KPR_PJ TaxID=2738375 RepID=UPI0035276E66